MKRLVFPFVVLFCFLITFLSCSNTSEHSRKPVSTISIIPNKSNYVFGEKVSVQVKTTVKNGSIDNIRLYYQNKLLRESNELNFTVENVELDELGSNIFHVVATKTDSVNNSRTTAINVVSDVVPKKLTFQIVNNYPHNHKFYTQGLEYKNGFIYEGTGENGESGLFKINLRNGNTLQSYFLDDKYFGEGITIFNDKIYQLTYHAQKGFIYNLQDFALIDSFQFNNQQGWGLTNDSENLIMSDGTTVLTWLNPDNFEVVKTVQVANDKGLINNINELEYINGTIYANIYTTNIIVQIDPQTGKVLSEINMAGILDMYRNSDSIDYMNGIAWDKENSRLFVTGKWWPRLFEIKLIPSE